MTDFGVDIGGGPTIDSLRDLWISAKGTHGSVFDGLRPVISVRDGKPGTAELRLVVGPLSNAAASCENLRIAVGQRLDLPSGRV